MAKARAHKKAKKTKGASKPKLTADQLAKNARLANNEHRKVIENLGAALQHAFGAGSALRACKDTIGHGGWVKWLAENCAEIKERTAQEYMWFAKNQQKIEEAASANGEELAVLSMRGARKLIAEPDDEEDNDEETGEEEAEDEEQDDEEAGSLTELIKDADADTVYQAMPKAEQQKLADIVPFKAVVKNRPDREICETLCKEMAVEDLMKLASGLVRYVMGGKDTPRERLKSYAEELWEICKAVDLPEDQRDAA
jgi:Protein of unknown function (DUF3102)